VQVGFVCHPKGERADLRQPESWGCCRLTGSHLLDLIGTDRIGIPVSLWKLMKQPSSVEMPARSKASTTAIVNGFVPFFFSKKSRSEIAPNRVGDGISENGAFRAVTETVTRTYSSVFLTSFRL